MTNKRFETRLRMVIDNEKNFGARVLNPEEIVELLNKFNEENEQLFEFKDEVFNSINGKIKRGEQAIEWGESIGADVGAMGFHIELLKMLKKELFE